MYFFTNLFICWIFRLPWDQRTLIGWIGLNLYSAAAAPFYLIINYAFLAFFIGVCEQQFAFYEFFRMSAKNLDGITQFECDNVRLKIRKLIQFHNLTRTWVSAPIRNWKVVETKFNEPNQIVNAFQGFLEHIKFLQPFHFDSTDF